MKILQSNENGNVSLNNNLFKYKNIILFILSFFIFYLLFTFFGNNNKKKPVKK